MQKAKVLYIQNLENQTKHGRTKLNGWNLELNIYYIVNN